MVYIQTDDRDFTVRNAGILFPYTIKELSGVMNLFGLKNGFAKVTPLVSYQGSAKRARER
jgi:hypothetical protein